MRILALEERVEALQIALDAVLRAEALGADDDGRDSMASEGACLLLSEHDRMKQAEKAGHPDHRRRRLLDGAMKLLIEADMELVRQG